MKKPSTTTRSWSAESIILNRFKKKRIRIFQPSEALAILNRKLEADLLRSCTNYIMYGNTSEESKLIYIYECISDDGSLYGIHESTNEDRVTRVSKDTINIPKSWRNLRTLSSVPGRFSFLGYPISILYSGSSHEKITTYVKLKEKAEQIRKKFSVP